MSTFQLLQTAGKIGSVLLRSDAVKLKDAIAPLLGEGAEALVNGASIVASPNGDNSHASNIFHVLSGLKQSLNGQATEEGHAFLQSILAGQTPLNRETLQQVLGIAEEVEKLPVHDSTGQGLLFNAGEPKQSTTAQSTAQPTAAEKPASKADSTDDTEVVLRNMLGLINTKLTKKNGHFYMFLKWAGPLLKFVGIKVPTPDELPGIVEKYITKNEKFTNALKACIENKKVDTSNMSWWQKWAFSGCKKLLKHLANNSERILEGGPQAAYALKYGAGAIIPILGRIPIIGRLLGLAFPFVVDELNSAGEVAEKGYLTAILERLTKYHGDKAPAGAAQAATT